MSIQWALVSGFLYLEIFWIAALLLPIFSANKWKQAFNSGFVRHIQPKAKFYFNIFLAILGIFFLDALREIYKYQEQEIVSTGPYAAPQVAPSPAFITSPNAVLEFRAQRNLYICGMALFLWFVIKRLIVLIIETDALAEMCAMRDREIEHLRFEITDLARTRLSRKSLADDDLDNRAEKKNQEAMYSAEKNLLRERSLSRAGKKEI